MQYIKYISDILISILLFFFRSSRNTMSSNVSVPLQAKDDKVASVDIDGIMDNVSIVLFTLTVVLGITGNLLVIWVAGFKLKVEHFFTSQIDPWEVPSHLQGGTSTAIKQFVEIIWSQFKIVLQSQELGLGLGVKVVLICLLRIQVTELGLVITDGVRELVLGSWDWEIKIRWFVLGLKVS